jgi:ribosomal protein S12 methylthiotransferase accessory factor
MYLADFNQCGVSCCRILVPGMSEIYPVDDLEWENNSIGNHLRPAILQLSTLDDAACAALLAELNDSGLDDQRLVRIVIGLAADPDTLWDDLRIGELKLLLALALGDEDALHEGLDWVLQFAQINEARARCYRCIAALLQLHQLDAVNACQLALEQLYGSACVAQARVLLAGEQRFFGITAPGPQLDGCAAQQRLLAAYHTQQACGTPRSHAGT